MVVFRLFLQVFFRLGRSGRFCFVSVLSGSAGFGSDCFVLSLLSPV